MQVRWTASGPTIYAYVGNDPLGSIDPQGLNADDLSETPGQRSLEQLQSQEHDVISPLVDTDLNNDGIQDVISPVVMNAGAVAKSGLSSCKGSAVTNSTLRGAQNPKVAEAAARGRQMHKDFDYGPGFRKEITLPSGKRADAVNRDKREVVELKPNNPNAICRGEKQVEGYRRELEFTTGQCWTCRVETYD